MKIAKRIKRLFHDRCSLLLCQKFLLCNVIEKFTSFTDFGHQEADSFSLPSFMQFDDVWMIKALKDCNFVFKSFIILYSTFLHSLHCNFYTSLLIFCKVHCTVTSAPKFLLEIVQVFDVTLARVNEPLSLYCYGPCPLALNHISRL